MQELLRLMIRKIHPIQKKGIRKRKTGWQKGSDYQFKLAESAQLTSSFLNNWVWSK